MMPRSGSTTLRILLAFAMLMTFRTFQFFPGMFYVQESWFVFCFLIVLFVYPFWKMRSGLRFSWFEIYLLVLMIAGVILAAWRAEQVFGQPLIYGILAQRGMALVAILLVLVNALNCGMVQLEDIKGALLSLAWGTFFLYSAMQLLLNPSRFSGSVGFVNEPMPGDEGHFKLQVFFILFGGFYYTILGIRNGRAKYYLAAAVLLFAAGLGNSRGFTISVVATLLFCLYRLRGLRKTIVAAVKCGCLAAVLVGVFYAILPSLVSARIAHFSDAFTVVFTGTATTQDPSANARIFETLTVLPYIQEHPLLGSGAVSSQWQGGAQGALGQYFYGTDIGLVGIVFSYGILGLILYLFQYKFAWSVAKRLPDYFYSPLLDATKAFILYTALHSLETGLCVWNAEVTLFFIALLGGIAAQTSSLGVSDAWNGEGCSRQKPALS